MHNSPPAVAFFDSAFGSGGIVTNGVPAGAERLDGVVVQPADGKIVAIGLANNQIELTVSRVLVLHQIEGWSYKQLASALNVPDATVISRLSQARRRLRQEVLLP